MRIGGVFLQILGRFQHISVIGCILVFLVTMEILIRKLNYVQARGETMIDVLTEICNRIWRTGEWPTPWTQLLIITIPKKGNLQLCQNYRTISLIGHSSKLMLKVILNRLKAQAEELIAEEQAGFRAERSTTEQIFNLRILCEKYLQHQQNLYHVLLISKKPLTEYGMQPYGPPCRRTTSVQI